MSAKRKQLESGFQKKLIKELHEMLPGALIYKNETLQGLPDLTILWNEHWALLECKREDDAQKQPNQPYYVEKANQMSFGRFIYPENKQEVLNDLQQAFGLSREACDPQSE